MKADTSFDAAWRRFENSMSVAKKALEEAVSRMLGPAPSGSTVQITPLEVEELK